MIRPWQTWVGFALCLSLVLAAMGWVSLTAVRLERAQIDARRQAAVEENVRLALWRMDSAATPLIAQEGARPYFAYSSFHQAERAYTQMFNAIEAGAVLVPSPLLGQTTPEILLHFQFEPNGALTSPQVPTGKMRELAEAQRYTTPDRIAVATKRLRELGSRFDAVRLAAALPQSGVVTRPPAYSRLPFPTRKDGSRRGGGGFRAAHRPPTERRCNKRRR